MDDKSITTLNKLAKRFFSKQIKALRMKNGLSLKQAGDRIGVSASHIWYLECGESSNPTLNILERMATAYGVSIATLLGDIDISGIGPKVLLSPFALKVATMIDREMNS